MAIPGRKPKPDYLRVIEGNPGRRPIRGKTPKPRRAMPRRPGHLGPIARAAWKRVTRALAEMGVICQADQDFLEGLVSVYEQYRIAARVVRQKGMSYMAGNGMIRRRPELSIMADSLKMLRLYLSEAGLTPTARTRVHAILNTEDEDDDLLD